MSEPRIELTATRMSDGVIVKAYASDLEYSRPIFDRTRDPVVALYGYSLYLDVRTVEGGWEDWAQMPLDEQVGKALLIPATRRVLAAQMSEKLKADGYEIDLESVFS